MLRRLNAIFLAALLALAPSLASANGFVAAADLGNNNGTTSSLTHSYTVTAGSDLLIVGVIGDITGGTDDVSGVTYNGSSMTQIAKLTACGNGGAGNFNRMIYLYYLTSPTSGAHNVVVSAGSSHWLLAQTSEYAGTNTSTPVEASNTNSSANAATTLTTSTTTAVANDMLIQYAENGNNGGGSTTVPYGTAIRAQEVAFHSGALIDSVGSVPTGSPALTVKMSGTGAGAKICVIQAAVEFNSVVVAPEVASKINGYAALQSNAEQASKINGFAVLQNPAAMVSKLNGYAVLCCVGQDLSKLNAYAVLSPISGGGGSLLLLDVGK
jgi:hypothetical protein